MARKQRAADEHIAELPDEDIRRPLWEFIPAERDAVAEQRRRRFPGLFEVDEIDPEYS